MNEWNFEREFWWDPNFQAVKFAGIWDGQRYVFAISRSALNDYFRTEDSREAAIINFEEHRDRVEQLATRLIALGVGPSEHGHYFISTEVCEKLSL